MIDPQLLSSQQRALLNEEQPIIFDDDLFDEDADDTDREPKTTASGAESGKDSAARNKRKRNRKKKPSPTVATSDTKPSKNGSTLNNSDARTETEDEIEIELVPEEVSLDSNYAEFERIFNYFKFADTTAAVAEVKPAEVKNTSTSKAAELERLKARMFEDEEDDEREKRAADKDELGQPKLSKKKQKKVSRLSVAALKQLVNRPDVVEMHDVTARDPKLLVNLKAGRNTVSVPRHWCAKRKYLQGKRGFEKPAFDLPDFIKRTGIQGMREAVQEKDASKSLKQKMREKVRPKMGKIDIDYQKLHDAFFRWQTKPRMSIHGDLYYEGKELETKLKEKKPGNLTDDLRISLGMPTGAGADKVPPPWLIAMQRYGPPPSYPSLKIPGLNAPIPDSCSFGYHAGGWGKPPVDEFGRPLYGDVFGSSSSDIRKPDEEEPVDQSLWGEMEDEMYEEVMPDEDEEDEDDDEDERKGESGDAEAEREAAGDDDDDETADDAGLKTPGEGLMTPSGISTTVSAGLETPDMIELRKRKTQIETDMESQSASLGGVGGAETPALYKILPERGVSVGASMMGSTKVYDLSAAKKAAASQQMMLGEQLAGAAHSIECALNPDELELSADVLQSRYDQQMRQAAASGGVASSVDDADELADAARQQSKKRKKQQQQAGTPMQQAATGTSSEKDKSKKYKEFKF